MGGDCGAASKRYARKRVPSFEWLPKYNLTDLRADLQGATLVGAMIIPQAMAYAILAELPPVTGLYSVILPCAIYAFLGTSPELSVGPVAMASLIVGSYVADMSETDALEAARLISLCSGIVLVVAGIGKFGFILEHILPHPVINGFTSGAAILIVLSQIKDLFGLPKIDRPKLLIQHTIGIFEKISEIHWGTTALGLSCAAALIAGRKFNPKIPWALILLVVLTVISGIVDFEGKGLRIVGEIPPGFPGPKTISFSSGLGGAFGTGAVVAIVGTSESVSVAKRFAALTGRRVKVSQEMFALGVCGVVSSIFQGYATFGALSRTAVNGQMGVRTPLTSLFCALVVFTSVMLLTDYLKFIPKALLAAIVGTSAMTLIDFQEPRRLYGVHRMDFFQLCVAAGVTVLMGPVLGIMVSLGLSLIFVIYRTAKPILIQLGQVPGTQDFKDIERWDCTLYDNILVVRIDCELYFANCTYIRERMERQIKASSSDTPIKVFIIEAGGINRIDSSAIHVLNGLASDLERQEIKFYWSMVKGHIRDTMDKTHLKEKLGEENFFLNTWDAVQQGLLVTGMKSLDERLEIHPGFPEGEGTSSGMGAPPTTPKMIQQTQQWKKQLRSGVVTGRPRALTC